VSFLDKINRLITESFRATGKYFYSKIITSIIIAVISYIVFRLLGVKFSAVLSVILGTTNLIPAFGPWVGITVCALISVFQEPLYALYASITALILQLLEQFLLIPVFAGKALDLKPLVIIFAVITGSVLFGFWGIIFAIPAAAALKIAYKIFSAHNEK